MATQYTAINFPGLPNLAKETKNKMRARGIHAWLERDHSVARLPLESTIEFLRRAQTRVMVKDDYAEIGPIDPVIRRALSAA